MRTGVGEWVGGRVGFGDINCSEFSYSRRFFGNRTFAKTLKPLSGFHVYLFVYNIRFRGGVGLIKTKKIKKTTTR